MKAILITLVILVLMSLAGWITFNRSDDSASVNLNTSKVRQDTSSAVDKGKELVDDGANLLKDTGEKVEDETRELVE